MALVKQLQDQPNLNVHMDAPDSVFSALKEVLAPMFQGGFAAHSEAIQTIVVFKSGDKELRFDTSLLEVKTEMRNEGFGYGGYDFAGRPKFSTSRVHIDLDLSLRTQHAEFIKHPPAMPVPAIKPKGEEALMLSKYKIAEVTLGEINPIMLEEAIEKLASQNSGFKLKEKDGKTYLITEGADPIELNGTQFKEMIQKGLVGKTLAEVRAKANFATLIQRLNVIEQITLTKPEVEIGDLFK